MYDTVLFGLSVYVFTQIVRGSQTDVPSDPERNPGLEPETWLSFSNVPIKLKSSTRFDSPKSRGHTLAYPKRLLYCMAWSQYRLKPETSKEGENFKENETDRERETAAVSLFFPSLAPPLFHSVLPRLCFSLLSNPSGDHMTGATYITASKNTLAERFMRNERGAARSSCDVGDRKRRAYVSSQTPLRLRANICRTTAELHSSNARVC